MCPVKRSGRVRGALPRPRFFLFPLLLCWALPAWGREKKKDPPPAPAAKKPAQEKQPVLRESKEARALRALRERLRSGAVLFSDDFDREQLGKEWFAEEGTWRTARAARGAQRKDGGVIGTNGAKYPDAFLWTKRSFQGDLVVECEARALGKKPRDINFVICGQAPNYPPPESPLYLFGIGGWNNTRTGVERAPDYRWKMLTGRFTIQAGKRYKILAARLGSKFYLFIDGELIIEARDPKPLPAKGQFAFHVYKSRVLFQHLRLRRPGPRARKP